MKMTSEKRVKAALLMNFEFFIIENYKKIRLYQ
jgi:hypothetical protein